MNYPKSPSMIFTDTPQRRSFERRLNWIGRTIAVVAALSVPFGQCAWAANTEYDVVSGQVDLTAPATYTIGGTPGTGAGGTTAGSPPSVTSDVTFDSGVTYAPASFTVGSNLILGSLDDLSSTSLTIADTGGAAHTITLGGAGDLGNSVPGSVSGDLLYVAGGSTLNLTGGTGTSALGLVLGQSGNFDVAGTANIGSIVSGGAFGLSMTGTGTLIFSGVNTYTGGTTINAGTLQYTNIGTANGTNNGAITLGGGTLQINQAANNFAYAPAITLTADSTLSNIGAGGVNFNGTLTGGGHALYVNSGPARLYINGAVSGVSQFNVTAGALGFAIGAPGNQGGGAPVVVSNGASFWVFGTGTEPNNVTLNGGTGLNGTGALYQETGAGTTTLSGIVTLNSTSSVGVGNNTLVLSGKVTGAGGLTKIGAGNLTLTNGTNDYSGGTTISAGTLQIGSAGLLGSGAYAASITDNSTFQYSSSGAQTISGNISGTGALTKDTSATGTLTLSGSNSYTGATNITAGAVTFAGANAIPTATAINFSGGGTTLNIYNDGTGSSGTIAIGNNITATNNANGTYTINVGDYTSSNTGNTLAFGTLSTGPATQARVGTFNLTGANGDSLSFTGFALPGSNGNSTYINPTTTSVMIGSVTNQITSASGAYDTLFLGGTSAGNFITGTISDSAAYASVGNGDTRITMQGTGAWTLAGLGTYHGATTVTNGTLNLTGTLTNTQSVATSGTGIFVESSGGSIGGTAPFTQGSTGTSVLAGANTYSGATSVNAGTLDIIGSGKLGSAASGLAVSNGSLDLGTTSQTVGAVTITGTGTIQDGSLTGTSYAASNATGTAAVSANLLGSGALSKTGAGTLYLSGANTYSGGTTVSAGTLEFANTAALPTTGTATVASGASLALGVGGAGYFSAANVNQYFTNTLANVNTSSRSLGIDTTASGDFNLGGLTLAGGEVINKLGANTLNLGAITRAIGTTVDFTVTGGSLTTTSTNTGTSILGGWATFGGGTTFAVSAGDGTNPGAISGLAAGSYSSDTWAPGNNTTVTLASNTITSGTTNSLRFNTAAADTVTLSSTNVISTGGILVTPTVGNNLSTITGGTLEGSSGGDLVVNQFNTSNSLVIASVVADNTTATALTKAGPGLLTLSGASTYTGGTYINGGTLGVTADSNLGGAGTITINGGTLQDTAVLFTLASNHILNIGSSGGGISSTYNGYDKAITLGSVNQLTGSGPLTLNNTTGSGNSSLVVNASQSGFTGNIVINSGRLELNTNGVTSPLGSGTITIANGATLGVDIVTSSNGGNIIPNTIYVAGGGDGQGAIHNKGAGTNTFSGPIILTANATVGDDNGTTTTFSGGVSGAFTFTLAGTNATYVLSGINTESTLNANNSGGTVQVSGNGTLGAPNVTLTFGQTAAKVDLNGTNQTIGTITSFGTIFNNATGTASVLTINGGGTTATTFKNNTAGTGTLGLTVGGGTLTLSGTSTYTGTTTVSAGTLIVSGSLSGTQNANVNAGTLQVSKTGLYTNVVNSAAALSLGATGPATFAMSNGGANLSATQSSQTFASLTLNNTSSVDFGSNTLGDGNALLISGNVTLSNFTSLAVLNWSGTPFAAGATIDPGSLAQDGLLFGPSSNALTAFSTTLGTPISSVNFYGDNGAFIGNGEFVQVTGGNYSGDFELVAVAVPEPGTWGLILSGVGMMALLRRRRRTA